VFGVTLVPTAGPEVLPCWAIAGEPTARKAAMATPAAKSRGFIEDSLAVLESVRRRKRRQTRLAATLFLTRFSFD